MFKNMSKITPPQFKPKSGDLVTFSDSYGNGFAVVFQDCSYDFGTTDDYNEFIPEYIRRILTPTGGKFNKNKTRKIYKNKSKTKKLYKSKIKKINKNKTKKNKSKKSKTFRK
jgi:hypothetical protein